jgi:hypothetical protein
VNPPDQSTPRTQAVWKTHCGFSNEDEATEAVCDFRDLSNTLERELAAAKEEFARFKESTWEHFEYNRKHAVARSIERDNDKDELTRLRAEVERLEACTVDAEMYRENREWAEKATERAKIAEARAEKAEASLAKEKARIDWLLEDNIVRFSASYSDRAAIDAAMKEANK